MVEPQPTQERERLIQSGKHYSEMLPIEYVPTETYMQVYREALKNYAGAVAEAVGHLADKIIARRGRDVVLVSLARAGTPAGILLKRYIKKKYQIAVPHYSISIIRGRGIDDHAMKYLVGRYGPKRLLFVDGWTGKGAILRELKKDTAAYEGVSSEIAVIADPAHVAAFCGTHEDILIPSSCLNSTVSGLISRTFLRKDIIGEHDFHGAVYYEELKASDLSYEFIGAVEQKFILENCGREFLPGSCGSADAADTGGESDGAGIEEVLKIGKAFGVDDINLIKPGIGEATRVLLRRVPWKLLIDKRCKNDPQLAHLVRLAEEKQVPVEYYPLKCYKCCGIIRRMADA